MTRALSAADRGERPYLWRFTPLQRTLHVFVIVSFFGLVLTGLPLHFAHAAWARTLVRALGGLQTAGHDTTLEQLEHRQRLLLMRDALEKLPQKLKVVFVMCALEGVPGVEAARVLKLREGTVWRRLHEARKELNKAMERSHK